MFVELECWGGGVEGDFSMVFGCGTLGEGMERTSKFWVLGAPPKLSYLLS